MNCNYYQMQKLKKLIKYSTLIVGVMFIFVIFVNYHVGSSVEDKIFDSVSNIPQNKVGLLLGVSKYMANGSPNYYYKYRIEAAEKLYKARKISYILVSGDNSRKDYDEPTSMKNDLIKRGVPEEVIFLDYAGFRTFDSVVRSKEIFGQDSITVISQKFHNERAIFIASNKEIHAIGYNAKDLSMKMGLKTRIREYFARVKMILDLTFGTKPHFLGEKVIIR